MKFLRAVEGGLPGSISECILRYPELKAVAGNPFAAHQSLAALRDVRAHVVELAHRLAEADMGRAQELIEEGRQEEGSRLRGKADRLLRRLQPGSVVAVGAVRAKDGTIATNIDAKAAILREHWSRVFTAKGLMTGPRSR